MENITYQHPQAHLIRVNRDYPQVPAALTAKFTPIQARGIDLISALAEKKNRDWL
jgi:hypothetical protein